MMTAFRLRQIEKNVHRPVSGVQPQLAANPRRPGMQRIGAWAARIVGATMLAMMAGIHLKLYATAYSELRIIGVLFLINGIAGSFACLVVLLTPRRWLAPVSAGGALLLLGTLAGLMVSLTHGLFGFTERLGAPYVTLTIVVESIGALVLAILAATTAGDLRETWARRRAHTPGRRPR